MKRIIKPIALCVAAVLACLSLCSCIALDEMKQSQAKWIDKTTSFALDGKQYIKLPECEDLQFNLGESETIHVTDPDVPVLLSESFGDYGWTNGDKTLAMVYDQAYAREDIYPTYKTAIETYTLDHYCYSKWIDELQSSRYTLYTAAEQKVIRTVIEEAAKHPYDGNDTDEIWIVDAITPCSEDLMFVGWEKSVEIARTDEGKFFLAYFDFNLAEYDYYQIPPEFMDDFRPIVQKAGNMTEDDAWLY